MATPWEIVQAEADKGRQWSQRISDTAQKWKETEFNLREKSRDTRRNMMITGMQQEHARGMQASQIKSTEKISGEQIAAQVKLAGDKITSMEKLHAKDHTYATAMQVLRDGMTRAASKFEWAQREKAAGRLEDHQLAVIKAEFDTAVDMAGVHAHNQLTLHERIAELKEESDQWSHSRARDLEELRNFNLEGRIDQQELWTTARFLESLGVDKDKLELAKKAQKDQLGLAERGQDLAEDQHAAVRTTNFATLAAKASEAQDFLSKTVADNMGKTHAQGGYNPQDNEHFIQLAIGAAKATETKKQHTQAKALWQAGASVGAVPINTGPATVNTAQNAPWAFEDLWKYDPVSDKVIDTITVDGDFLGALTKAKNTMTADQQSAIAGGITAAKLEAAAKSPNGMNDMARRRLMYVAAAEKIEAKAASSMDGPLNATASTMIAAAIQVAAGEGGKAFGNGTLNQRDAILKRFSGADGSPPPRSVQEAVTAVRTIAAGDADFREELNLILYSAVDKAYGAQQGMGTFSRMFRYAEQLRAHALRGGPELVPRFDGDYTVELPGREGEPSTTITVPNATIDPAGSYRPGVSGTHPIPSSRPPDTMRKPGDGLGDPLNEPSSIPLGPENQPVTPPVKPYDYLRRGTTPPDEPQSFMHPDSMPGMPIPMVPGAEPTAVTQAVMPDEVMQQVAQAQQLPPQLPPQLPEVMGIPQVPVAAPQLPVQMPPSMGVPVDPGMVAAIQQQPPPGYFNPNPYAQVQVPQVVPQLPPQGYFNPYAQMPQVVPPQVVQQQPPPGYFNPQVPGLIPQYSPSQAVFTG